MRKGVVTTPFFYWPLFTMPFATCKYASVKTIQYLQIRPLIMKRLRGNSRVESLVADAIFSILEKLA